MSLRVTCSRRCGMFSWRDREHQGEAAGARAKQSDLSSEQAPVVVRPPGERAPRRVVADELGNDDVEGDEAPTGRRVERWGIAPGGVVQRRACGWRQLVVKGPAVDDDHPV